MIYASQMAQLLSEDEYRQVIQSFQSVCPKAKTSNYLLPGEAGAAIREGLLYYLTEADTLILFVKSPRLYHAYVQTGGGQLPELIWDLPIPCILDEPVRAQDEEVDEATKLKWNPLGFGYRTSHMRMVWKPENPDEVHTEVPLSWSRTISQEMCDNWYQYLDTVALSVPDQPCELPEEERMCVIQGKNGEIASQMKVSLGRKLANVHFLVTIPSYRGQGLAKEMMRGVFMTMRKEIQAEKMYLWVDVSNRAGINSYTKVGYKFDRLISHQYIISGKDDRS